MFDALIVIALLACLLIAAFVLIIGQLNEIARLKTEASETARDNRRLKLGLSAFDHDGDGKAGGSRKRTVATS